MTNPNPLELPKTFDPAAVEGRIYQRWIDGGYFGADPADVRSWPVEHFARLLAELAARGRPALALSGPGEAAVGERVRAALPAAETVRHWVGQRGLRELAG